MGHPDRLAVSRSPRHCILLSVGVPSPPLSLSDALPAD
jgi:hypothetical protein